MLLSVSVNVDSLYRVKRVSSEGWCSIRLKQGQIHLLCPYRSIWHYFTAKHTEHNSLIREQESSCFPLLLCKKKKTPSTFKSVLLRQRFALLVH